MNNSTYNIPQNNIKTWSYLRVSVKKMTHDNEYVFKTDYYRDTLVFKLGELDEGITDMNIYVVYDYERDTYVVYGSRMSDDSPSGLFRPFAFEFECEHDVYYFIRKIVGTGTHGRFNYELYSLSGLPTNMDDINFHLLNNFVSRTRELAAFDNMRFSKTRILEYLQLIASPIMMP